VRIGGKWWCGALHVSCFYERRGGVIEVAVDTESYIHDNDLAGRRSRNEEATFDSAECDR
jgi:hypothetical protein